MNSSDSKKTKAKLIEEISTLRSALDSISDGFILFDADDRVLAFNSKHADLFPSVANILEVGLPFRKIIETQVGLGLFDAARGNEEAYIEARVNRHQNVDGPPEDQIFANGKIIRLSEHRTPSGGTVAVRTDITDLKLVQQQLQESEQKFRDFAEMASDWLWEMDEKLRFTSFSGHFSDVFNLDVKTFIGKTRRELSVDGGDDERWQKHLEDLDNHFSFDNFAYQIKIPNSEPRFISVSGRALFDDDGTFVGYRGTGSDITERKRAEKEIAAQRDELQKLNAQKDKFFSIIAHDLRGPFTALLGFSSLLSSGIGKFDQAKVEEYGGAVHESAERMLKLLENLLEWSRLQMGQLEFVPGTVNLKEIIDTNLGLFAPTAKEKAIQLIGKTVKPLNVFADAHMVDAIVRNLVNNAIKFTPEQGHVAVSARRSGNWGEVEVLDTGVGMSADKAARLFQLDQKTSTAGTAGETGTGLGLLLCKELVERQGGRIHVESTEGEGSSFRVTLPLNSA